MMSDEIINYEVVLRVIRDDVVPVRGTGHGVVERDRHRRHLRSRSLTTVDQQSPSLEPRFHEGKGLEQRLAAVSLWNEELKSALSAKASFFFLSFRTL